MIKHHYHPLNKERKKKKKNFQMNLSALTKISNAEKVLLQNALVMYDMTYSPTNHMSKK